MKATLFEGADHIMFDWKSELNTILHLLDLKTGQVKQFHSPSYLTFHYIKALRRQMANRSALTFQSSWTLASSTACTWTT